MVITVWRSLYEKTTREKVLAIETKVKRSEEIRLKALEAGSKIFVFLVEFIKYNDTAMFLVKNNIGIDNREFMDKFQHAVDSLSKLNTCVLENAMYLPEDVVASVMTLSNIGMTALPIKQMDKFLEGLSIGAHQLHTRLVDIFQETYIK